MTNVATVERRVVRAGRVADLTVVALAVVAAVAVWTVLTQLLGVELEAPMGGRVQEIGLAAVVVSALVGAGVGAGLLRLLEARTTVGLRAWTVVVVLTCLLSLVAPASAPTTAAVAGLVVLHVVVLLVLVLGLRAVRRAS